MPVLQFYSESSVITRYPDSDLSPKYSKAYVQLGTNWLPANSRIVKCYWTFDVDTSSNWALWYEPADTSNAQQAGDDASITFQVASVSANNTSVSIALGCRGGSTSRNVKFRNLTFNVEYEMLQSTFTLDRAEVDAGQRITATIKPSSTAYTHKITFTAGSRVHTVDLAAGETAAELDVPMEWLEDIPRAVTLDAVCELETFKSGTSLGANSKSFVIRCPDNVVPVCELDVQAVNDFRGIYLAGRSAAKLTIRNEKALYGASVVGYQLSGGGLNVNLREAQSGALPQGEQTFVATVTDTRGRKGQASATVSVLPYLAPGLSGVEVFRSDVQGAQDDNGAYLTAKAVMIFSDLNGSNSAILQARFRPSGGAWSAWQEMTDGKAVMGGTLLASISYEVAIQAEDAVGTVTGYVAKIPTASVAFNIKKGGNGAAFGMYQEHDKRLSIPADWDFYKGDEPIAIPGQEPAQPSRVSAGNLLDNSSFADPVAQAGLNGKHGNDAYAFDRWKATSVTASKQHECMRLTASVTSARIGQKLEAEGLAGKTVTVAVKANAPGKLYAGLYYSQGGASKYINASWDALNGIACVSGEVPNDATNLEFRIYPAYTADFNYADVYWAALYEGSYTEETLPPYIPKGYGHELVECMRYFQRVNAQVPATSMTTATRYYTYNLPIPMRVAPSMTSLNIAEYQAMTATGGTGAANNLYANNVRVSVSHTISNINGGLWVMFRCDLNADL